MEQLPAALAGLASYRQFMLWKPVWNEGKQKFEKYPVHSTTLEVVNAHDPLVWIDADTAIKRANQHGLGVAFVFTKDDPFFFVDIDKCLKDDGQWSEIATALCQHFTGSAVEVSHSGRGLHIIGTAPYVPHGCKNTPLGLELYTQDRFIALTGTGAVGDVGACPPGALERAVATYFPPGVAQTQDAEWTTGPVDEWSGPTDDAALLEKMLKAKVGAGAVFGGKASVAELWQADEDALGVAYPDEGGSRPFDNNSADAALCQHLAFWTGKDCERIDRLFRMSELIRDKWRDREDYRQRTILFSVGNCTNVYSGKKSREPKPNPEPVDAEKIDYTITAAQVRSGAQFLTVPQQIEHFKGCIYVREMHRAFIPDGSLLKPEQFKSTYGGYVFTMDPLGEKTTTNAWEVFTESQAVRFPRAHIPCFRPELLSGALVQEEGRVMVNTYVPIETARAEGDPEPFLNLVTKMLPIETDRDILLAYMAACVQHAGIKFQWTPLLQGLEGNGKTLMINCIAAAVGHRYTHLPNASDLGGNGAKFNYWLINKLFIGVEEIYVSDRREVSDALKPLITNSRIEIQGKGADQVTGDNRANFFMCSNHKDAVLKTRGDRRYCVFYTAQQEIEDLTRDGMRGDYFPRLYSWLKSGGYAVVANYLSTYKIPEALNPATLCHRAPQTSSTTEAIALSMGGVEQEILEAIDEGRPGFANGWVSSLALDRLLQDRRDSRRIQQYKRKELLRGIGYTPHPGLKGGRVNNPIMQEGGSKPRLYIKEGHISANLTGAASISKAYSEAQGFASASIGSSEDLIQK